MGRMFLLLLDRFPCSTAILMGVLSIFRRRSLISGYTGFGIAGSRIQSSVVILTEN
jgi:hypothetical protein